MKEVYAVISSNAMYRIVFNQMKKVDPHHYTDSPGITHRHLIEFLHLPAVAPKRPA
jgi:hypothetical protein